tara:strand:- start:683 stop:1117 length:435 start_codon:yes stop_codon:yes gene_type:complete
MDVLTIDLKSFGGLEKFYGQIVTLECPEDNSKLKELVHEEGANKVIFVQGNGSRNVALLGDLLASKAIENNWSGIIINGCVRDVEILKKLKIGIYALGACPKKSYKENKGVLSSNFIINDTKICNGHWVYCDLNGILLSEDNKL